MAKNLERLNKIRVVGFVILHIFYVVSVPEYVSYTNLVP